MVTSEALEATTTRCTQSSKFQIGSQNQWFKLVGNILVRGNCTYRHSKTLHYQASFHMEVESMDPKQYIDKIFLT